jgi:hypothetical protein
VIVADTSGLLALFDRSEPQHEATRRVVGQLVVPIDGVAVRDR